MRRLLASPLLFAASLASPPAALAQAVDVTVFAGAAYPIYDERLTINVGVPSIPGVDVTAIGVSQLKAKGGSVFGGAIALEGGIVALEGRLDSTKVALDFTGARYNLRGTQPPFEGTTGTIIAGEGRFEADRFTLWSINLRLRTPGPVGLTASGGLSYLPDVTITGSVPLSVQVAGISLPSVQPRLRLTVVPGEADHRFGINGGGGVRIGGGHVGVIGEVRVFYFREFKLRFAVDGAPDLVADLLAGIDEVRFDPVIVNAQAGLVFKF